MRKVASERSRSTIRLRTFLALVAMLAVALAFHANRIARELREQLAEWRRQVEVAAEERAGAASIYRESQSHWLKEVAMLRLNLEATERLHDDSFVKHGVAMVEPSGRLGQSLDSLRGSYAHVLKIAGWNQAMATNFDWAAKHPSEPYPPSPPFPQQGWNPPAVARPGSIPLENDASAD